MVSRFDCLHLGLRVEKDGFKVLKSGSVAVSSRFVRLCPLLFCVELSELSALALRDWLDV